MRFKLLTEHHLEFLSLKGDCKGSSEPTYVKMPHFLEISCRGTKYYVDLRQQFYKRGRVFSLCFMLWSVDKV